jgi:L-threonylcarbamoyladenylate synthase
MSMADVVVLPAHEPGSVTAAVGALCSGEVIAFPTDTVYGLGAHSAIASALHRLYELKGRERQKAIPLLIAGVEGLSTVAIAVPRIAWRLAEQFWPGPVTLVVPKAPTVLDAVTSNRDTVAVRVPAHEVALRLISALGAPLAATSANLSGHKEAVTAGEVQAAFESGVRWILDGGRCAGGVASTVVDVTTAPPLIRRRGALVGDVEAFLSEVV